jgi:hypothetical protein
MTRKIDVLLGGLVALVFLLIAGRAGAQTSVFVGTRVGKSSHGEDVRVKREIGSASGYDDRLQAIAVARMSGADPTVVVKGNDGKWHALETTANFYGGGSSADNTYVREIFGLPSNRSIAEVQRKVEAAKSKGDVDALSRERRFLASLVFGVDEKEILQIASSSSREAGRINVTANLGADVAGQHGAEKAPSEEFKKGTRTAIEVSLALLDAPAEAAAVLFHETSHRLDYELAQAWASRYEGDTRRTFSSGRVFTEWLMKRDAKVLSRADAELCSDVADGANGATEARAYVRTFLAALQAGAPDVAAKQLRLYAGGLTGDAQRRQRINPPTGAYVATALEAELETAYRGMSKQEKASFDSAFAAIKQKYPGAWISKFDHERALRRR